MVFIFISSITLSLITSITGQGMKSHDGHSEESEVIRENIDIKKYLQSF